MVKRASRRLSPAAALCAALLGLVPGRAAAEGDAAALLAELRSAYATTEDLHARFVQRAHLVAAGMDTEAQGEVWFQKGGKMRWAYQGDDPQVIVSDGTTLWIHQVRDRTVLRQELASVPPENRVALDLLSGFDGLEAHFTAAACGERCLELLPRNPMPDLARVQVLLDAAGRGVRAVTTEDPLGNRTTVELSDLVRNAGVPAPTFAFVPPPEAQVLEMGVGGQ